MLKTATTPSIFEEREEKRERREQNRGERREEGGRGKPIRSVGNSSTYNSGPHLSRNDCDRQSIIYCNIYCISIEFVYNKI